MILYPAIDILDGRAVRLAQGRFDESTVYDEDPLGAAQAWVQAGARFLHIVDLDGARAGRPINLAALERIVAEVGIPVQYGGGLRDLAAVGAALAAGAARAIVGTAAYSDIDFLDEVLATHGSHVLVSVDVRDGSVATRGWTEDSHVPASAVIDALQRRGVTSFVYSSIERDGMLSGPDLEEVQRIAAAIRGRFIYSGGVGSVEDLAALARLRLVNLAGVIVGRALYERRFTIAEAQVALQR